MNGERTLSKRWTHAKRNLVSAYEQYANAERKHERKMNGVRTVNDMWTIYERKLVDEFGVPLKVSLQFDSSVIRRKLHATMDVLLSA